MTSALCHQSLLFACAQNDPSALARALTANAIQPMAWVDDHGESLLFKAARAGSADCLSLLLGDGSLDLSELGDHDPLIGAVCGGSLECVELLLHCAKLHPNHLARALACAVIAGSDPCVDALLAQGARPLLCPMQDGNALHCAVAMGRPDLVARLAPLADDPDEPNLDGGSAFCLAASRGQWECVQILAPVSNIHAVVAHGRFKGHDAFSLARLFWAQDGVELLRRALARAEEDQILGACSRPDSRSPRCRL